MIPPDTPPKELKAIEAEPKDLSDYENEKPPKKCEINDIFNDMRRGKSSYVKISMKGGVKHVSAKDAGIVAGLSKGASSYKIKQKYDEKGHIKSKDGSIIMKRLTKESDLTDILNSHVEFEEFHTGETFDIDKNAEPDGAAAEDPEDNSDFEEEEISLSPTKGPQERAQEFAKKYVEENELIY